MYALIVVSGEARTNIPGRGPVTSAGTMFWVCHGLPEAMGERVTDPMDPPKSLKTFHTIEEAEAFANEWNGFPWYVQPIKGAHQIYEVLPQTKEVLTGYIVLSPTKKTGKA